MLYYIYYEREYIYMICSKILGVTKKTKRIYQLYVFRNL